MKAKERKASELLREIKSIEKTLIDKRIEFIRLKYEISGYLLNNKTDEYKKLLN